VGRGGDDDAAGNFGFAVALTMVTVQRPGAGGGDEGWTK